MCLLWKEICSNMAPLMSFCTIYFVLKKLLHSLCASDELLSGAEFDNNYCTVYPEDILAPLFSDRVFTFEC